MLDITQLNNSEYILENFIEVQELSRILSKEIDKVAERVKTFGEIDTDDCIIGYSEKVKYSPRDINKILELYPMDMYPIYNISLNKEAKNIIKDTSLMEAVRQKVLTVTPK